MGGVGLVQIRPSGIKDTQTIWRERRTSVDTLLGVTLFLSTALREGRAGR